MILEEHKIPMNVNVKTITGENNNSRITLITIFLTDERLRI